MSIERHYFPGNNTPQGFFSYYRFILGQREARRIFCLKGGPGTGKSTFLRGIGEAFLQEGEDVDFLHCSADENSLDGVILHNRKIALIDGTSPHVTDPVSPGAVDKIIDLREYWNEEGIAASKAEIIDFSEEGAGWYRICYNYLCAAKSVYRSLEEIYNSAAESSEIYRIVADIIGREFQNYDISLRPGRIKKFFASAVTASGTVHYLDSLLSGFPEGAGGCDGGKLKRIYFISVPAGFSNRSFMDILTEGALYRGMDVEAYYCSMCPEEKIEHLLIPSMGLAFITVNEYHDLEPWEIAQPGPEIVLLDTSDYMNCVLLEGKEPLITALKTEYDMLLRQAVKCLGKAREAHDRVEEMYIPNMHFAEISELREQVMQEIRTL